MTDFDSVSLCRGLVGGDGECIYGFVLGLQIDQLLALVSRRLLMKQVVYWFMEWRLFCQTNTML